MKYPSNAAPRLPGPGGSQGPAPAAPPRPANDNFPKPPRPANDNVRRPRGLRLGKYLRLLRHPLVMGAAYFLLDKPAMGLRTNLDGYAVAVDCAPGGNIIDNSGNCGDFIVNNPPFPSRPTGRPINISLWSLVAPRPNGLQWVVRHHKRYHRTSNTAGLRTVQDRPFTPLPAPEYDYPPVPALAPNEMPIGAPAPVPAPIPFPLIPGLPANPHMPGGTGRVGGNGGRARLPPWRIPSIRWDWSNNNPNPVPKPVPHRLQPPQRGERERKVVATVGGVPMHIVSALTDFNEIVMAFYSALPVHRKIKREYIEENRWSSYAKDFAPTKRKRPRTGREITERDGRRDVKKYLKPLRTEERLAQVLKYYRDVDMTKAMQNLVENEVEDAIIGRLSGGLSRQLQNARKRGYIHRGGLQLGPAL